MFSGVWDDLSATLKIITNADKDLLCWTCLCLLGEREREREGKDEKAGGLVAFQWLLTHWRPLQECV